MVITKGTGRYYNQIYRPFRGIILVLIVKINMKFEIRKNPLEIKKIFSYKNNLYLRGSLLVANEKGGLQ